MYCNRGSAAGKSHQLGARRAWDSYIESSGVSEVLAQANALIEQEIRNLEKAPLGFTSEQLQSISSQFRSRLGSERLKQDMIAKLEQEYSQQKADQLRAVLNSKQLKDLQHLQAQLDDAEVRRAMRSYRIKVQEATPSAQRMQLIVSLDELLQQSTLETELKVELRKQLLATVSHLKTSQTFSEELLDKQLLDYRQVVEGEISENALFAYLYLLKRTPSSKVRDLLVSLDQPAFDQFMAICLQAMQESFRDARQQIQEQVRLAEN